MLIENDNVMNEAWKYLTFQYIPVVVKTLNGELTGAVVPVCGRKAMAAAAGWLTTLRSGGWSVKPGGA